MKIGIDCRLWNETGVGRYIRNLVQNLGNIDKTNDYVLFTLEQDCESIKNEALSIKYKNWKIIGVDIKWHSLKEQILFPRILNEQNLDLVHFPYFSIPFFYRKPFVVTVHDLIINSFNTGRASTLPLPLYYAKRVGYNIVFSTAVRRAKKIIVPSKAVKQDLLNTDRNVNSNKIKVTYEGGFDQKSKIKNQKSKIIEGRYLLRVGNFYPHKNVERLLLAFKDFLYDTYENHDVKLVLVGKRDYFFKRIKKQTEDLTISANVVFFDNVSDSELALLYENAVATIIPSFMEGFSLTAVEAMSCASPVIVSDIPAHREICGSAAIYCNPRDVNDIKQKINLVLNLTDKSREELIKEGKKQARKFSWQKMTKETLNIYNSAIKE